MKRTLQKLRENGINLNAFDAATILGSGLSDFEQRMEIRHRIPYASLPDLPETTVSGHRGELITGSLRSSDIIVFSGRFHIYEGLSSKQVTSPVRLAHELGANKLIVTNSAGGINLGFQVGDIMVIEDILRIGQLFVTGRSNTTPFRHTLPKLSQKAVKAASQSGISVQKGCYVFASGPSYETSAEIEVFRRMGGDAVGMSTVPELCEARRIGLPVFGLSLISNMAADIHPGSLSHDEIKQASTLRKNDISNLIGALCSL